MIIWLSAWDFSPITIFIGNAFNKPECGWQSVANFIMYGQST